MSSSTAILGHWLKGGGGDETSQPCAIVEDIFTIVRAGRSGEGAASDEGGVGFSVSRCADDNRGRLAISQESIGDYFISSSSLVCEDS
jgi:hypothetical protein